MVELRVCPVHMSKLLVHLRCDTLNVDHTVKAGMDWEPSYDYLFIKQFTELVNYLFKQKQ